MTNSGTTPAPPGKIYKCDACEKKSKTRYGFLEDGSNYFRDGTRVADSGYDIGCAVNAKLVDDCAVLNYI